MQYKSIVVDYKPKAKNLAAAVETKANEMSIEGWEFVTFSVTNSAKAVLVFRKAEVIPGKVDSTNS